MEALRRFIGNIESAAVLFALAVALVIHPYKAFKADAALLLPIGICLAALILALCIVLRKRFRMEPRIGFASILVAGLLLRLIVGLVASPEPVSDGLRNVGFAQQFAQGEAFVDLEGRRAFFPPGYPLFLAPFFLLLRETAIAVTGANLVLYAIGACSLYALGRRMFDERVATFAALLYALWPGHVLLVGIAAKENLIVPVLVLAMLCLHAALDRSKPLALGLAAGGALGAATLGQPGLSLLFFVFLIGFRDSLLPLDKRKAAVLVLMAAGFALTIAPWMIRNYIVFEGRFSGLATNGGSVLYRANNPLATGLYLKHGERSLEPYDEVTASRVGRQWAWEWISTHPLDAAKLSMKKFIQFLTNDAHAAYWALYRSQGEEHETERARVHANPASLYAYRAAYHISNAFWLVVLACAGLGLLKARRQRASYTPLIYPFLYLLAVHSVFESGSRHHMAPFALLLLLAAYYWSAEEAPVKVFSAYKADPALRAG
jgi:4-amino-4-deoxy-L-arabinose transferase-like glycosyltransferase